MAQPDPYAREYDFEGFQSGHPSTPLPGDKVNDELDAVDAVLDQVLARIALLQDDDLALKRGSVGYDQLNAEVDIGFVPPTLWATATTYPARSTVFTSNNFYRCLVAHTSGTFSTDLADGKWELVADFTGATTAAEAAQAAAEVAQTAAEAAQTAAEAAQSAAVTASANAATSASSAATSSASASGFADNALASATASAVARDAALAAQTGAETAQTAAGVAQTGAETAQTAAEAAAALSAQRWVRVDVIDDASGDPATGYEAGDAVDSVTLTTGMLVLRATAAGDAADGVYVVPASGAASRATIFNDFDDLPGSGFRVVQGTVYGNTEWRCVSALGGTLGVTALLFTQLNAATTPFDNTSAGLAGNPTTVQTAIEALASASNGGGSLLLALAVSESTSTYVATGELFADGYGSLGMVDNAGATNLDTSEAGYLKPSTAAGGDAGTSPFGGGGGRGIGAGNGDNFALQFVAGADGSITSAKFNVPSFTTPGTFEARLYTDSAGSPGVQVGTASASQSVAATGDKTFTFGTPPPISNATTYWMVFALVSGTPAFNVSSQADTGAAFKSGRGDVITALTDNLPILEEWEVEIIYVGVTNNVTVRSEIIPVGFEPSTISGRVRVVPTDALTLNTDIFFDVSRDDGVTWTQVVLALLFTDGGVSVLSFSASVSAQPSGSSPRWRARSANSKNFKIDGVALEFGA